VAKNAQGEQANRGVPDIAPAISGDGRQVAFVSAATNLVSADSNDVTDVYSTLNEFLGPTGCPDGVCPDSQVCVNGFCVAPTGTVPPSRTPTPTNTPQSTRTPSPTATFRQCAQDSDCL